MKTTFIVVMWSFLAVAFVDTEKSDENFNEKERIEYANLKVQFEQTDPEGDVDSLVCFPYQKVCADVVVQMRRVQVWGIAIPVPDREEDQAEIEENTN